MEGQGGRAPLMAASAPPFRFTQNYIFEISRNDKTANNDGKRNNQWSKNYCSKVMTLLHKKLHQKSNTITIVVTRGAGTSKRQGDGGQLFQKALSILYVQSYSHCHQHCSLILSNNQTLQQSQST